MTKKEVYAKIQRDYEKDRSNAEIACARRKQQIYVKIPRLAEIQSEISNTGTKLAEIFANGGDRQKNLIDFRNMSKALQDEQAEILKANNLPKDYLDVKYKCEKCKDTGYIDNNRCECFKNKLIQYYYDMSNISKIIRKENFDNFNIDIFSDTHKENGISTRENMMHITKDVIAKINDIENKPVNIIFCGTSGLGKSYLSNCVAKMLMDRGISVIYMSAYNICNTLVKQRFSRDESGKEAYDLLTDCDMLIIDDLGTEGVNNQTSAELFNLINNRFINNKSTLITTNYTVQDIYKVYSARIGSRIIGNYKCYKFFGEDLRLFK